MADNRIDFTFLLYAQDPVVPDWEPDDGVDAIVEFPVDDQGEPDPQIYLTGRLNNVAPFQAFMEKSNELQGQTVAIRPRYVLTQGRIPDGQTELARMRVRQQGAARDGQATVYVQASTNPQLDERAMNGVIHVLAMIGYAIQGDNQSD